MRLRHSCFAFLIVAILPLAAFAAPAGDPAGDIHLDLGTSTVNPVQEASDQKTVDDAMADMQREGFAGLERHLDALRAAMAHAPSSYPMLEQRGHNVVLHFYDPAKSMELTLLISAMQAKTGGGAVLIGHNTYPMIALLLASYADEFKRYDEGDRWTARGLAMQPHNWMLALERASSMAGRHRPADAVAVLSDALEHGGLSLSNEGKARLLRNKGSALIDLKRYDEAQAALNESIRLLPDNPQARNELQYLARMRAGGAPTDVQIVVPPAPAETPSGDGDKPQKGN